MLGEAAIRIVAACWWHPPPPAPPHSPPPGFTYFLRAPLALCPLPSLDVPSGLAISAAIHGVSPPPKIDQVWPSCPQICPQSPSFIHLKPSVRPSKFRSRPKQLYLAAFSLLLPPKDCHTPPLMLKNQLKNSWSHLSFHQSRAESTCPVAWSLMPGLLRTLGG